MFARLTVFFFLLFLISFSLKAQEITFCDDPEDAQSNVQYDSILTVSEQGLMESQWERGRCLFHPEKTLSFYESVMAVCAIPGLPFFSAEEPCSLDGEDSAYAECVNSLYAQHVLKTYDAANPLPQQCPNPQGKMGVSKFWSMVAAARSNMGFIWLEDPVVVNGYSLFKRISSDLFYDGPNLSTTPLSWGINNAHLKYLYGMSCGRLPQIDLNQNPDNQSYGRALLTRGLGAELLDMGFMSLDEECLDEIVMKFNEVGVKPLLQQSLINFMRAYLLKRE